MRVAECRPAPDSRGHKPEQKDSERNRIAVVMIRLARVGARKQPYYRVVVIEKDRARNGRSIEVVGTYNPRTNPATVNLKHERIAYWRGVGAQFSSKGGQAGGEVSGAGCGCRTHGGVANFPSPGVCKQVMVCTQLLTATQVCCYYRRTDPSCQHWMQNGQGHVHDPT